MTHHRVQRTTMYVGVSDKNNNVFIDSFLVESEWKKNSNNNTKVQRHVGVRLRIEERL